LIRNHRGEGDQVKKLTKKRTPPKTKSASQKPHLKRGRKPSAASEPETPAGQGGVLLRDAVNDAVGKASKRIAKALVDNTCDGNSGVAHIVVKLSGADKAPPETKKKRGPQPWIQQLCSEPEWTGPWEDEDGHRDASKLPPSDYDLPDDLK
jgi:hypothetical protein